MTIDIPTRSFAARFCSLICRKRHIREIDCTGTTPVENYLLCPTIRKLRICLLSAPDGVALVNPGKRSFEVASGRRVVTRTNRDQISSLGSAPGSREENGLIVVLGAGPGNVHAASHAGGHGWTHSGGSDARHRYRLG